MFYNRNQLYPKPLNLRKMMDSIKKVNKVCKAVKNLTEEDFKAVFDMAKEQIEYTNPLKMATASKLNDTGEHNFKVIEALRNLKIVIESR